MHFFILSKYMSLKDLTLIFFHASVPERDAEGRIHWVANEGARISHIVEDALEQLARSSNSKKTLFEMAFNLPERLLVTESVSFSGNGTFEIPIKLSMQIGNDNNSAVPVLRSNSAKIPEMPSQEDEEEEFLEPPEGLLPFSNPSLECIVVRIAEDVDVQSMLKEFEEYWEVEPIHESKSNKEFDLLPKNEITVTEAWNAIHQFRSDKRIALAEPVWEVDTVSGEVTDFRDSEEFLGFKSKADRKAEKKHWAPDLIGVTEAWNLGSPQGKIQGEGIRVAHPDSGYTNHHELVEIDEAIDVESGYDFVDDNADPVDEDGFHGTGTASVLMSGLGGNILGVAPKATLVPMRVAQKGRGRPAPVLLRSGMRLLRTSIERAIDQNCHVISISLGWFGHTELHNAIKSAWEKDIIIVAAAGNYTQRAIVWPAKHPECICMAGCDANRGVWGGSARGSRVDFTAPAQDVWKAGFNNGQEIPLQSSGTSFATAMTAGVAALWLAYHGRQNLIDQYSSENVRLTEVFRTVMNRSVDASPNSWFGGFGGIVNAENALLTPLPLSKEVRTSFGQENMVEDIEYPAGPEGPSLNTALEMLGKNTTQGLSQLAASIGVSEAELEIISQGCGDELAFHCMLAMGQSSDQEAFKMPTLIHSQMSERLKYQIREFSSIYQ